MRLQQGLQVQAPLDYRQEACLEPGAQEGFRLLQLRAVSVVRAEVMAEAAEAAALVIALMLKLVALVVLVVLVL